MLTKPQKEYGSHAGCFIISVDVAVVGGKLYRTQKQKATNPVQAIGSYTKIMAKR